MGKSRVFHRDFSKLLLKPASFQGFNRSGTVHSAPRLVFHPLQSLNTLNEIHRGRTEGLHKLKVSISKEAVSKLAFRTYNYFQFFDEFESSQNRKTERLHRKRYRRIKYGSEKWPNEADKDKQLWQSVIANPCHDCAAIIGQYHCEGCDAEQCPRCRGQLLGCSCKLVKDFD